MPRTRRSKTPSAASLRPPEPIVFFLDESLDSLSVVSALTKVGAAVERLTTHFPRGTPDEVWLGEVGRKGWVVLTRDKRIRYRHLERLALQTAGVRAFVFTGGNVRGEQTAAILVEALKRIERICRSVHGPCIYHIGRSGKPRRMQ